MQQAHQKAASWPTHGPGPPKVPAKPWRNSGFRCNSSADTTTDPSSARPATQAASPASKAAHPGRWELTRQAAGRQAAAPDPFADKRTYEDSWLDQRFISFFASSISKQLGGMPCKPGYEGLVDLSMEITKGRPPTEQTVTVLRVLEGLLPPGAPAIFRRLFPLRQWSAELNAKITKNVFAWLVGPLDTMDVEVEFRGRKETWHSGVHIEKCRYLEAAGCKGMCTNMCKLATQEFFTEKFGLPLTMRPNFEDLSCEMTFGETPKPIIEDDVYNEPCFIHQCAISHRDPFAPCPKISAACNKGVPSST